MTGPHSDTKYIKALHEHDMLLIKEIYRNFAAPVKHFILHNGGSTDDFSDIFQEGLMAVYHIGAKSNFVLTCPFGAFLFTICKRHWLMHLRSLKSRPVTNADNMQYELTDDERLSAENAVYENEKYQIFEKYFAALSESCRLVLKLAWSGNPLEEVARMLNNSYAYIRKKKSECTGKLSELIKNAPEYKILLAEHEGRTVL